MALFVVFLLGVLALAAPCWSSPAADYYMIILRSPGLWEESLLPFRSFIMNSFPLAGFTLFLESIYA